MSDLCEYFKSFELCPSNQTYDYQMYLLRSFLKEHLQSNVRITIQSHNGYFIDRIVLSSDYWIITIAPDKIENSNMDKPSYFPDGFDTLAQDYLKVLLPMICDSFKLVTKRHNLYNEVINLLSKH